MGWHLHMSSSGSGRTPPSPSGTNAASGVWQERFILSGFLAFLAVWSFFLFGLILSNNQFKGKKKSLEELFEKARRICWWLQVAFFFASSLWSGAVRDPELYCCRCWDVAELGGSQAVSSAAVGMWRVNRTIWWLLFHILKNRPKLQLMKFL